MPTAEVCDGADQDCDGIADNGVVSTCGNCDAGCHRDCVGVGCATSFEAGTNAARTAEGAIVPADPDADITPHSIWLPTGRSHVIYRVDSVTLEVIGAYQLSDGPDRVSIAVDPWGNGFFGQGSVREETVFRIDAGGCGDVNRDGVLTTSTGEDDLLPLGQDDCVRWRASPVMEHYDSLVVVPDGRLWVGVGYERFARLDGETGASVDADVELPFDSRVMLAADEGLWFAGSTSLCLLDWASLETTCSDYPEMDFVELDLGADGLVAMLRLASFDPASGAFIHIPGGEDAIDFVVDGYGRVWAQPYLGSLSSEVLYRFDEAMVEYDVIELETWSVRIAADLEGQIWTVGSTFMGDAAAYDAETGQHLATLLDGCDGGCLDSMELEGDPAGLRLRRAFPDDYGRAEARAVLEAACAPAQARRWSGLSWRATEGVLIEARSAPDRERLAIAPWTVSARTPPEEGSLEIGRTFDPRDAFVEIRARLQRGTAHLDRVEIGWRCDP